MNNLGAIISVVFIVIVARLLLKKYNPHAVLLVAGFSMLIVAQILDYNLPKLSSPTGNGGFDLFAFMKESFAKTNAKVGLMIMAIGGFVSYIDKIGASAILVKIALKPLGYLRKHPDLAAIAVLPIGQLLFVCIPSAAGLGLLLMASVFPILTSLGVSRLSAVSVITACTAFGIGPASAITASATHYAQVETVPFFLGHQLPLVWPLTIVMMITYYFVNRYFDRKNPQENKREVQPNEQEVLAPKIYALIPILPLILLIVFSGIIDFLPQSVKLDTTTAMFISLAVAMIFELIRSRSLKATLNSLNSFWNGMGNIFKTVVTLIVAADIFSMGLVSLGFIDGLVNASLGIGLGIKGIGMVMTVMIFLASMLMGSGNAAFFAFAPLIPKLASRFGVSSLTILLPMNLSASMGRTVSPVAGVMIATAEIAGVSTLQIVKRNIIPLSSALVVMLIYHFLICF